MENIFLAEITKVDHYLSENFYFIKISFVFTESFPAKIAVPTHSIFDPKNWITSSLKINSELMFTFDIYKTTWYFKTILRETLHINRWKY